MKLLFVRTPFALFPFRRCCLNIALQQVKQSNSLCFIHMDICMQCACVIMYTSLEIHLTMCIYNYIYIYIQVYMYIYIYTCMCICMSIYIYMYMYICMVLFGQLFGTHVAARSDMNSEPETIHICTCIRIYLICDIHTWFPNISHPCTSFPGTIPISDTQQ